MLPEMPNSSGRAATTSTVLRFRHRTSLPFVGSKMWPIQWIFGLLLPHWSTDEIRSEIIASVFGDEEALDGIERYVIEVTPIHRKRGLFNGRIWVEKETLTIIRFDGIYQGSNILARYFHFDSRRRKDPNGLWVPSVVSSDEMGGPSFHSVNFQWTKLHFQAVTHFFGYKTGSSNQRPTTLAHYASSLCLGGCGAGR
jgi:hypothetical protein